MPTGRNKWIVYLSCLLVFAGFCFSRLLISLGVIGLIAGGLLSSDIRQTISIYFRTPVFYINTLFFLVILFSGINSSDTSLWLNFLRIKVPFLILPFAFCGYRVFDRAFFSKILFVFVTCMIISASAVMINYALHYDDINQHILSGSVIPVPFSHIRYTLLLVFSFFSLIWLWEESNVRWRFVFLIFALYLFIIIHVLSSRSGWMTLYLGLLLYFFVYIYRSRRFAVGVVMVALLVALPFILYQALPSLHNKIAYMRYTINQYREGHMDGMSDAMRIASWQTGMEIIRRHPYTGTGVGDLQSESKSVSKELFPHMQNEDDRKMPHNEFIWIWAGTGVFGFIAYCLAFFYPFLANFRRENWLFGILFLIFFASFLTEPSIEEQIGSTFYLVFLLIFLAHFHLSPTRNE